MTRTPVPLTPERIAYAKKRIDKLQARLRHLEEQKAPKHQILSTRTSINRWDRILNGSGE